MYRFLVHFIKIALILHVPKKLNITCVLKVIEIYFNAGSVGVDKDGYEVMLIISKLFLIQFFYWLEFILLSKVALV